MNRRAGFPPKKRGLVGVAVLLASCSPPASDALERDLLESVTEEVILPTYEQFATDTEALSDDLTAFCAASLNGIDDAGAPTEPDAGTGDAVLSAWRDATDAWRAARVTWKRGDAFAFGPYADQPDPVGPSVDLFPVREAIVDRLLFSDEPLDPGFLMALGTVHKGLPVTEYLLFGVDGWSGSESLVRFSGAEGERRCAYLVELGRALHADATRLLRAWNEGGFAERFVGAGGTPRERHDSVGRLLNTLITALYLAREEGLEKPAGLYGEAPVAGTLLSPYADHAAGDVVATLEGAREVFLGSPDGDGVGFDDYLVSQGETDLAEGIAAQLGDVAVEVQNLDPLREAIVDFLPDVEQAYERIRTVERQLSEEATEILKIPVAFGAGDGD